MTTVTMEVSQEDIEAAGKGGEFVLPPVGYYVVDLTALEPGFSKGDDGEEDKSRPYLKATYKITGVGRDDGDPEGVNYGNLWDYVVFSVGWKKAEFLLAMGLDPTPGKPVKIKTEELVGKRVLVRIKHEKDNQDPDEKRARIAKLLPYSADGESAGAQVLDLDAAREGGGEDPFAGETEPEADLLEQEGLEAMDLKELGGIAKEFDLDPNDSLVKNGTKTDAEATKAAIIKAILTAQNGDGDPEEDDDNPF